MSDPAQKVGTKSRLLPQRCNLWRSGDHVLDAMGSEMSESVDVLFNFTPKIPCKARSC